MANSNNLINLKDRTQEERRAIAIKGNKASQAVKKEKKRIIDLFDDFFNGEIENNKTMKEYIFDRLKDLIKQETNISNILKLIEIIREYETKTIDKRVSIEITGLDKDKEYYNNYNNE